MEFVPPAPLVCPHSNLFARRIRSSGHCAVTILAVCISLASPIPLECEPSSQIGASKGELIGGTVGIGAAIAGTVVAVVIIHNHHFLRGCVSNGADGIELTTDGAKIYRLEGNSSVARPGDRVKLHGSKRKSEKGGPAAFTVAGLVADYGPCPAH